MRTQTPCACWGNSSVRDTLIARNRELTGQLREVGSILELQPIFPELAVYLNQMRQYHRQLAAIVSRNLQYLDLGEKDLLEDILSNTKLAVRLVQVLSSTLLPPIARANPRDRLTLRIISWLHEVHDKTQHVPAAFSDGECSVKVWKGLLPKGLIPPIYHFPVLEQRGLLYQPLNFHEFGHVLYAYHKSELDDIVRELQADVEDILLPVSMRNDRHAEQQASRRQAVVDTWYRWAQELFCDAVGLVIGGPAFLSAFSAHLAGLDRGDYYRDVDDLRGSSHPVTWIRIQALAARAGRTGLQQQAVATGDQWNKMAELMRVRPDFHGYFDAGLLPAIGRALDDMLIETAPRHFRQEEIESSTILADDITPIHLVNAAWRVVRDHTVQYSAWEEALITRWLSAAETRLKN